MDDPLPGKIGSYSGGLGSYSGIGALYLYEALISKKSMSFCRRDIFSRSFHKNLVSVSPGRSLLSFGYQNAHLANKMPKGVLTSIPIFAAQ
jgi:hypothetical protein